MLPEGLFYRTIIKRGRSLANINISKVYTSEIYNYNCYAWLSFREEQNG